jgi:hypothetical protein
MSMNKQRRAGILELGRGNAERTGAQGEIEIVKMCFRELLGDTSAMLVLSQG